MSFIVYVHPNPSQPGPKLWAIKRETSSSSTVMFGACGKSLQTREGKWDVVKKCRAQEREGYENIGSVSAEHEVQVIASAIDSLLYMQAQWAVNIPTDELRQTIINFCVKHHGINRTFANASVKMAAKPVTSPPVSTTYVIDAPWACLL